MARRSSFVASSRVRERRLTSWALGPGGGDDDFDVTSVSAGGDVILGQGVTPTIPNMTLVRIRGKLFFHLTSADGAGSGYTFGVGIGIVSNDAFAVGVTAVPKPIADADWPGWLWYDFVSAKAPIGAISAANWQQVPQVITIDSKAMRKFRNNETLFVIVELAEVTSAVMEIACMTRILLKLP